MTNQEIITAVKRWQDFPYFHPLTCGNNSNHLPLIAVEENGLVVLKCSDCDYIQKHIPECVLMMPKDEV